MAKRNVHTGSKFDDLLVLSAKRSRSGSNGPRRRRRSTTIVRRERSRWLQNCELGDGSTIEPVGIGQRQTVRATAQ